MEHACTFGEGGGGHLGGEEGALISVSFSASVLHKSQMPFFFSFLFYFFIHVVCDFW